MTSNKREHRYGHNCYDYQCMKRLDNEPYEEGEKCYTCHGLHDCGYVEDTFACKIRHIQINTGDANSKRSRWDQAADRHNEHHF